MKGNPDPVPVPDRMTAPTALPAPASRDAAVRAFVRRHYGIRGSLRLHRTALGWDLLRAPLNVSLAPVFLLTRLLAWLCGLLRLRRPARWLATRQILLKSRIARHVEDLIRRELVEDPATGIDGGLTPARAALVEDYTSVRSAVSEITTTLIVLVLGAVLFGAATPGLVSLAPKVSDVLAHGRAVAGFPLGSWAGSVWYSVFPPQIPLWTVISIGVALAIVASLVTTFAGILADPVQAALGIHRRRLMRLLGRLDAAETVRPGVASEHLIARMGDVADAATSLARLFRP